jgi:hypothetical protein
MKQARSFGQDTVDFVFRLGVLLQPQIGFDARKPCRKLAGNFAVIRLARSSAVALSLVTRYSSTFEEHGIGIVRKIPDRLITRRAAAQNRLAESHMRAVSAGPARHGAGQANGPSPDRFFPPLEPLKRQRAFP